MEDGLLSLKWNNHRSTFFHVLAGLRDKAAYTDATLACEGEFFPVHKLVMSTCSDYFSAMFERTSCKSPVIVLKDVKRADLASLLDYMYIGEVDVRQSDLAGLIKAAECLRIKGLAVPDEDPAKAASAKKSQINNSNSATSRVPEHRRTSSANVSPSPKRQRRDSSGGSSPHRNQNASSSSVNPSASNSNNFSVNNSSRVASVPSQSSTIGIKGGGMSPGFPSSPEVVPVEHIKQEIDDGAGDGGSSSRSQLDHRGGGGSDLEDDSGGGADDLGDFSSFTQDDIEKQEHDQLDYSEQLAGPSGLQGDSSGLGWGEGDEGGFPHNLFGTEDPNQQQVNMTIRDSRQIIEPNEMKNQLCSKEHFWEGNSFSDAAEQPPNDEGSAACHEFGMISTSAPDHFNTNQKEVFKCPHCSFNACFMSRLQTHLRVHTGEKPYQCPYCTYRASQKGSLGKHLRIHTGDKPYSCNYCEYRSSNSSNRRAHVATCIRKRLNLP